MQLPPVENRDRRRAEIVRAALKLLDAEGFAGLSLRAVARELGMHTPGLYWYVSSKQELLDLVAKEILAAAVEGVSGLAPGETWREWLTTRGVEVRRALLAHRDGARVVVSSNLFETHALTPLLELSLQILEAEGFQRDGAMLGTTTVIRFAIGVALDEQVSPLSPSGERPQGAVAEERLQTDEERWPRVADVVRRFLEYRESAGIDHADIRFRAGLGLIVSGMSQEAGVD